MKSGIDQEFEVQRIVRNRGLDVLSQLYQRDIIQTAVQATDSIVTPTWFVQQMYPVQSYNMQVDGWYLKVNNLENARLIKQQLEEGTIDEIPNEAVAFEPGVAIDRFHPFFSLVSKAIIGENMLANNKEEGWMIVRINQRTFVNQNTIADGKTDTTLIQKQFAAFTALNDSITDYRQAYAIKLDTVLFNEIYELKSVD
jgi:hypothetical protein